MKQHTQKPSRIQIVSAIARIEPRVLIIIIIRVHVFHAYFFCACVILNKFMFRANSVNGAGTVPWNASGTVTVLGFCSVNTV